MSVTVKLWIAGLAALVEPGDGELVAMVPETSQVSEFKVPEHEASLVFLQEDLVPQDDGTRSCEAVGATSDGPATSDSRDDNVVCSMPIAGWKVRLSAAAVKDPDRNGIPFFVDGGHEISAAAQAGLSPAVDSMLTLSGFSSLSACGPLGESKRFGNSLVQVWDLKSFGDQTGTTPGVLAGVAEVTAETTGDPAVTFKALRGDDSRDPLIFEPKGELELMLLAEPSDDHKDQGPQLLDTHFYAFHALWESSGTDPRQFWPIPHHVRFIPRDESPLEACVGPFFYDCTAIVESFEASVRRGFLNQGWTAAVLRRLQNRFLRPQNVRGTWSSRASSAAQTCLAGPPICPKKLFQASRMSD
ncbi:MAG: hypothetical protein AAF604_11450 [Acidobacteriota bacterium]